MIAVRRLSPLPPLGRVPVPRRRRLACRRQTAEPGRRCARRQRRGARPEGDLRVFKGIPYRPAAGRTAALASRRSRCRAGTACATRPRSARPASSPTPQLGSIYTGKPDADERGLPDAQHLGARATRSNAPVFFWIYGGALSGGASREPMYDGAQARRARRGRGLDQLSAGRARLARPSRAQRGMPRRRLRQLRPARPDRGAALGASTTSPRSAATPPTSPSPANPPAALSVMYLMASPPARGLFAKAIARERLHGLDARAEAAPLRRRRRPKRPASRSPTALQARRTSPPCARWTRRR